MKKIEPFDWEKVNEEVSGMLFNDATKTVCYEIVQKMNELIEAYNKDHNET